jgi:hypothetical protein
VRGLDTRQLAIGGGLLLALTILVAGGLVLARAPTPRGKEVVPTAPPSVSTPAPTTTPPAATTPRSTTAPPPALPPSPTPSPALWDQAGVFVWNTHAFDPRRLVAGLQEGRFAWVAFNVHDGLTETPIDPEFVRLVREAGFVTGAWGVERDQPEEEAALAVRLVRQWGFAFYIADAEATYKADAGGVFTRSKAFVDAFRAGAPDLPAALTTYGAAPTPYVLPIDFAAWRRGGFDLLPQAYVNESALNRPDLTIAHAIRAGWDAGRVHPVVGVYRQYPAQAYLPLLKAARSHGFSVYLADQMSDADYVALGQAIAAGLAAPR